MTATQQTGLQPSLALPQVSWQRSVVDRLLSLHAILALAVAALILVAIPRSMADPDIWWHLRNAQEMLTQHGFVRHDTYSFTVQGVPWIDHEWLAELPFYMGWRAGGATGVSLVTCALILSIFMNVLWLCQKVSGSMVTACFATFGAALLSTVSFGPRTLLFGWLCLVGQLVILELFQRDPRVALALPPLYLLWVNLHGSWLIGLAVLVMFAVTGQVRLRREWLYADRFSGSQNRMLAFAGLGIVPALFCNPWGWRLVAYPFNFAFHQTLNVASVDEWRSLDLHSLRGRVVIAVIALLVGRQFWRPRAWSVQELLLLGVGFYAAFHYSRFLFLLALLAAPVAARSFPAWGRSNQAGSGESARPGVHALLALAILFVVATSLRKSWHKDTDTKEYPGAAMPLLDRLPPGSRIFNEFSWGGYLEWSRPGRPVFIDSRVDIFEYNGVLRDYLDVILIKKPFELLDRYRVDAVLFESDTPLVYLLRRSGGWRVTYDDGQTALVQRVQPFTVGNSPGPAQAIARSGR